MTSKHKVLNWLYASKLTRNEYGQSVENAVFNHYFLKRNGEQWKQFLLILLRYVGVSWGFAQDLKFASVIFLIRFSDNW